MKNILKKYFIPHGDNNYHPHILHTKRAVFYTSFFASMKIILLIFAISVPEAVFMSPDVLALQEEKVLARANEIRQAQGLSTLTSNVKLNSSASLKTADMAENQQFSHTDSQGNKLAYYLNEVSYNYAVAGENLAMGYSNINDLFKAWVESESHYRNIVDERFLDTGVGVSAGFYDNIPTIYVTQHFGAQKKAPATPSDAGSTVSVALEVAPDPARPTVLPEKIESETVPTTKPTESGEVDSESITASKPEIEYNQEKSYLAWQEGDDGMVLKAYANLSGEVDEALVTVKDYSIVLNKDEKTGGYIGSLDTKQNSDDFFKVIFPPRLLITSAGETTVEPMRWQSIKVSNPTPWQKYEAARENLSPLTGIFGLSHNIYLFFLVFFTLALTLNIVVEIRKQHPHIIAQTLGMIGILIMFFVI